MSKTQSSKIDDVLGYTEKFSNWGTRPRRCLPSVEREKYIYYQSNRGLTQTSLRLHNRYVDEYLIFVRSKKSDEFCFDDLGYNRYQNYINSIDTINDKTKRVKLCVAKNWIAWFKEKIKTNS